MMCGRYSLEAPRSRIAARYFGTGKPVGDVHANYNITPGSVITLVREPDEHSESDVADFSWAHWGYRPRWAVDDTKAPEPINARAEKVAESKYFRGAFAKRRGLIPATGWYEWMATETGKQPYFIRHQDTDETLFFGAIWDATGTGTSKSTAIITRPAAPSIRHIHDRMPLVLDPECFADWMDSGRQHREAIKAATKALDPEALVAYPVSRDVNKPANNRPDLMDPIG